jgi:hypothetical protein
MDFDFSELLEEMLKAAQDALGEQWDAVQGPIQMELTGIAAQTARIKIGLRPGGELDPDDADIYEQMLRNRVQNLGILLVGLAKLTIQKVVNAVMDVIIKTLKGLISFV